MARWNTICLSALALAGAALTVGLFALPTLAQHRKRPSPLTTEIPQIANRAISKQQPGAKESVEADISARNVPVRADFEGVEIVVFGAVDNSQQPTPESGYYDVIVVVEGTPSQAIVRRKSNLAGLWINTSWVNFDNVPSFYAIASTRPLDEIATEELRSLYRIGLRHLRFAPSLAQEQVLSTEDLATYREALVRLKEEAGLFVQAPFTARFSGKSLFSARILLPANVTVGSFYTRVYLFHEQKLLSEYSVRLYLEREGLERYLHDFAFGYPILYGITTVAVAVSAGLLASMWLGRVAS
jgi:uncharacterized protein (TIGR02186 family)